MFLIPSPVSDNLIRLAIELHPVPGPQLNGGIAGGEDHRGQIGGFLELVRGVEPESHARGRSPLEDNVIYRSDEFRHVVYRVTETILGCGVPVHLDGVSAADSHGW